MELVLWWWHKAPRLQRWHRRAFLNRTARLMVIEGTLAEMDLRMKIAIQTINTKETPSKLSDDSLWMILSMSMYPDARSLVNVLHAAFTGNYDSTYDSVLVISCPNEQAAQDIGRSVMERNLAARVNILPGTTAMYNWKSKTKVGSGILILVKTLSTFRTVEAHIRSINPYVKLEAKVFVGRYSALHEANNDIFPLRLIKP